MILDALLGSGRKFKAQLKKIREKLHEGPAQVEDCLEVAKFYFLQEDYEKAAEVEKEILKAFPNDVRVLCNLATCLRAKGRGQEAKEVLHKILSIDPNNESALKCLEEMTG